MNEIKVKDFAKQFVELVRHHRDGAQFSSTTHSMSFRVGDRQFTFWDSDAKKCEELFGDFYRESGWDDKYSEDYSDQLLRGLLGDLFISNNTATAEASLAKYFASYSSYQQRHSVLVPLFGITLDIPTLSVGRVTLVHPTENELAKRLGDNLETPAGQFIVTLFRGRVLAEFEAIAEPIRAKEMAIEETRRALEILRYAIPFIFQDIYKRLRIDISIVGDRPDSDCVSYIVPSADTNSMTFTTDNSRPALPVRINAETVAKLRECGAMEVAGFLEKPIGSLTDFERMLLRGVHWFGNALCHGEPENELLSLTTCLETFLTPKDGNPIGTAIAEGVAILLSDKLEERKTLKKRVKDLYGKRSGVSHGGEKAVFESDLVELRDIAKRLIHRVIGLRANMASQKALLELIENSKLS